MKLTMLLTFFLYLLQLWVGVCEADVLDDDPTNLTPFIYTNPYLKVSDNEVIVTLAEQGKCMSLIGWTKATSKGLASCGLNCYLSHYNTWDCVAPAIDESNPDWSNIFTDEFLFQWTPGTCSCSNSSNPTPDSVDDDLPESPTKELATADATKQVRQISSYGYELTPVHPSPRWTFWSITFPEAAQEDPEGNLIGVFGVPNDNSNPNVLRVHETWASNDKRDPSVRAFMHDTVLGFWRLDPLNRNLNDLQQIRFDECIEKTINAIVMEVYTLMGYRAETPIDVKRNGHSPEEREAFQLILTRAKFAKRIQQATQEYEEFKERTIEAFYFSEAYLGFNFAILLDGYDPLAVGGRNWRRR